MSTSHPTSDRAPRRPLSWLAAGWLLTLGWTFGPLPARPPAPRPAAPAALRPPRPSPCPAAPPTRTALVRRALPALYLVAVVSPSGRRYPLGTAFAVGAEGLLATNAHVCEALARRTGSGDWTAVAVRSGSEEALPICGWRSHPRYRRGAGHPADVAVLRVATDGVPLPAVLPLAGTRRARELAAGEPLLVLGFPGRAADAARPLASASTGVVARITRPSESPGPASSTTVIQHTAAVSAGSSGSPLLDAAGRVVGIHQAGLAYRLPRSEGPPLQIRSGAGIAWAVRVDVLRSLLDDGGTRSVCALWQLPLAALLSLSAGQRRTAALADPLADGLGLRAALATGPPPTPRERDLLAHRALGSGTAADVALRALARAADPRVVGLCQRRRQPNARARVATLEALAWLGARAGGRCALIERGLADPSAAVRAAAATAAGRSGARAWGPRLLERLSDSAPRVRRAACVALGRIGATEGADPLWRLYARARPLLRQASVAALGALGSRIERLMCATWDPHRAVSLTAHRALLARGSRSGLSDLVIELHAEASWRRVAVWRVVRGLAPAGGEHDPGADERARHAALEAWRDWLAEQRGDGLARRLAGLHHPLPEARARAMRELLAGVRPDDVPRLAAACRAATEPGVRCRLLRALGRSDDVRARPSLLAGLTARDVGSRRVAARALIRLAGTTCLPALGRAGADPDPQVREAVACALARRGQLARLTSLRHDPDARVRRAVWSGLAWAETPAPLAWRVEALADPSARVLAAALEGVEGPCVGMLASTLVSLLPRLAERRRPQLARRLAAWASAAELPQLVALTTSGDGDVAACGARRLLRSGDAERRTLVGVARRGSPAARATLSRTLGRWRGWMAVCHGR